MYVRPANNKVCTHPPGGFGEVAAHSLFFFLIAWGTRLFKLTALKDFIVAA